MSDTSLFEQTEENTIAPDPTRKEPGIWVRRLVIVERRAPAAAPIRDIVFRRGLNVIATEVATESDTDPVGHNVGKTLLTRLIRFCLGETHFANERTRTAVARKLPFGYVIGEIIVAGQCWCVARPIGSENSRHAWAVQADDWRTMLGDPSGLGKYDGFRDALESTTVQGLSHLTLPISERAIRWLDLLAWLSRDQHCRYRHPHEWRSPEADSGTGNPAFDDAAFLVRACCGLLDNEEQAIISERATVLHDVKSREDKKQRDASRLGFMREALIARLGLSADSVTGPAFGHVAEQEAEARRLSLTRLRDDVVNNPALVEADRIRDEALQLIAQQREELRQLQARQQGEEAQLNTARTSSYFAALGSVGPDCPRRDCPLRTSPTGDQPEPWRDELVRQLSLSIASRKQKTEQTDRALVEAQAALQKAQTVRNGLWTDALRRKADIERQVGGFNEVATDARRYSTLHEDIDKLDGQIENLQKKAEQLRARQREVQDRLSTVRQQFETLLNRVCRTLVGRSAAGRVELSLRGVELTIADDTGSTGEALATSIDVLSLDMTCLLASIAGVGQHPRFLIHDSPREADLETHIYNRLFRLAAELEEMFQPEPPSFQYIVTTTTPPPTQLNNAPYVVCRLDGRDDIGLALGLRI